MTSKSVRFTANQKLPTGSASQKTSDPKKQVSRDEDDYDEDFEDISSPPKKNTLGTSSINTQKAQQQSNS